MVRVTTGLIDDAPDSPGAGGYDDEGRGVFSPEWLAVAVDLALLSSLTALLLLPFAGPSLLIALGGGDPLAPMVAGLLLAALVPPAVARRFGTPSDLIRAATGLAPAPATSEAAERVPAGAARRCAALVLDAASFAGLAFGLCCLPAGIVLIHPYAYPLTFACSVLVVAFTVAAFTVTRRPNAPLRSPGLTLLGLARMRTGRHVSTVLAPPAPGGRAGRVRRVAVAALWLLWTVPTTGLLSIAAFGIVLG